ncbi:hypothetical protein DUI87_06668 [Hirundo rustica rustica]|uniref:MIF4G domain-containing protein n=1 Tax=Hirundo rustica rustica TaxID=333673 RepID=A0A3M0KUH8_HIRRU|nr:hypothetical protein DUI87_06668 [Hirundo rustica rustica]
MESSSVASASSEAGSSRSQEIEELERFIDSYVLEYQVQGLLTDKTEGDGESEKTQSHVSQWTADCSEQLDGSCSPSRGKGSSSHEHNQNGNKESNLDMLGTDIWAANTFDSFSGATWDLQPEKLDFSQFHRKLRNTSKHPLPHIDREGLGKGKYEDGDSINLNDIEKVLPVWQNQRNIEVGKDPRLWVMLHYAMIHQASTSYWQDPTEHLFSTTELLRVTIRCLMKLKSHTPKNCSEGEETTGGIFLLCGTWGYSGVEFDPKCEDKKNVCSEVCYGHMKSWEDWRQQRLPSGNKSQQHADHQQGGTKHNRDHQKLYQGGQAPHSSGRTGHHGYSQNRRWHHNQKHSPNDKETHRNAKETENLKIEDSSACTAHVPAEAPRGPEAAEKQSQPYVPEPETKRKDSTPCLSLFTDQDEVTVENTDPEKNKMDKLIEILNSMRNNSSDVDSKLTTFMEEAQNSTNSEEMLGEIVKTIYQKAVTDRSFASTAAKLCDKMALFMVEGTKFRSLLLNMLQDCDGNSSPPPEELRNWCMNLLRCPASMVVPADSIPLPKDFSMREELQQRDVERWLGFITFLCEVFGTMRSSTGEPFRVLVCPIYTCLREPWSGLTQGSQSFGKHCALAEGTTPVVACLVLTWGTSSGVGTLFEKYTQVVIVWGSETESTYSQRATNVISSMERNSDIVLILQASVCCTDASGWQPSVAMDLDSGSPGSHCWAAPSHSGTSLGLVGRLWAAPAYMSQAEAHL